MSIVVPAPAQSGYVFSDYVYQTRQLVHDALGRLYAADQVEYAVNDARERVARDSCCVRFLQTNATYGFQANAGQETYNIYQAAPLGPVTCDVMGITVYWGNQRVVLNYLPWNRFNASLRPWVQYQGLPACWSRYAGVVYIAPVPQQVYAWDWDTALIPNPMQDDTTPEQIINPFQNAVKFWAAKLLKEYEQSFGEADRFEMQYKRQMQNCLVTYQRRTFASSYPSS